MMKKRRNTVALLVVLAVVIGLPAALFGYQTLRTQAAGVRVIEITARTPQDGGFMPDHIALRAGEPLRLRISSPDVVHGFSIPGLSVNVKEILPGKPVDVEITPQKPGRYAFACIRWCGVDHWRMRGEIEVVGPDGSAPAVNADPPLYQRLGQSLDAMRVVTGTLPMAQPSAGRGATLGATLPANLSDPVARHAVAPADAFRQLRVDPANARLSDGEVWDLLAWAWLHDVKAETLTAAQKSYTQDCAACHGPEGKGDGVAGKNLPGLGKMDPTQPKGPADFTDKSRMLAASDAVLQGKMLRGGMGTGMPEFGSLYTDEELWALVSYIRTFSFAKGSQ
jgi:mono/diheme cytochrome c family protein